MHSRFKNEYRYIFTITFARKPPTNAKISTEFCSLTTCFNLFVIIFLTKSTTVNTGKEKQQQQQRQHIFGKYYSEYFQDKNLYPQENNYRRLE